MTTQRDFTPPPEPDSHYRQIVESAVDYAIVSCDTHGRVTAWNEGARRVLGWEQHEMLGRNMHRFFVPEDVAAGIVEQEFDSARRDGRAADERWHMRKSGERFWASGELMPLKNAQGEVSGFVKILRDKTSQREGEARLLELNDHLQASQARLSAALGDLQFLAAASAELASLRDYQATMDKISHLALPRFGDWCSVSIVMEDGSLRRVSVAHADPGVEARVRATGLRISRMPVIAAAGGPWKVLRTGQAERFDDIGDDMLARAMGDPREVQAARLLGLRSYMGVPLRTHAKTIGVVSFGSSRPGRYTDEDLALAEDLAARAAVAIENAKLLDALQESDRAKDVFLATLAHELRNPLAPVWHGLGIIKHDPADAQRVQHLAEMIERQVAQLARLVDDLLDVSRITTGKIELKKERTSLSDIVRSAIETSRPHMDSAGHELTVRLPDEGTELVADPVRLAQVFSNLLNNAAKYTRPGGKVEVEVKVEGDWLTVYVRDNGAGIAPDMLGKVFSLFTQVTHPSERSQGGLGIGLSLVQALVRLHGGRVEARSEGIDKGSEFIVFLPREGSAPLPISVAAEQPPRLAPGVEPAPHAPAPQPSGPRRVLVVDDNEDAAVTLAELIRMMGNEADVAHDGASALTAVSRMKPDVVLLDIGLPDINGYEVARRIRAMRGLSQPRLIALTGWGQAEDKRMAQQAGFDEHWTKPVDPARLQELGK